MADKELTNLFCRLVSIPSPSGEEAKVAGFISKELKRRGIRHRIDNTGSLVESNTGNVIAIVPGGKTTITFIAHMDTVEKGDRRIKPVISKGIIKSDGRTILGADNKAAVAALIIALGEISKIGRRPTVTGIFTTREEQGIMGITHVRGAGKDDFTFALDVEGPPGEFVNKALGSRLFDIELYGKEAHAALNPDKGANAVKAAGIIISSLKLGRRKKGSILNVGIIEGGRKRNVIPGASILKCATRAFDTQTIEETIGEVERITKKACRLTGCKYKMRIEKQEYSPPFYTKPSSHIIKLTRKATAELGLRCAITERRATFEANQLPNKRNRLLVMCQGGFLPHSTSEKIKVDDLEKTEKLIVSLAKNAAEFRN